MAKTELKKFPFEEFKSIYSRVPRLCVDIVIETKAGLVLTKRTIPPAQGWWHLPGGTVLKGERLDQAVRRLAKEELGVGVKVEKLIGVIEYSFKNYFSQPIGLVYAAKIVSGKLMTGRDADSFGEFATVPQNTIKEQKAFLRKELDLK